MAVNKADQKYQEKQRRRKGLQKTRFYCQLCERQCMDENGFKLHAQSETHMRKLKMSMEKHTGNPQNIVKEFSEQFHTDFVRALRIAHGRKKVGLNQMYQEYIADKDHVHLNATCWRSLGAYARYLQGTGECTVVQGDSESESGERWWVAYKEKPRPSEVLKLDEMVEEVPIEIIGSEPEDSIESIINLSEERPTKQNALGTRGKLAFSLKKKK
jgi:DNA/RNA-binding protein KIN17